MEDLDTRANAKGDSWLQKLWNGEFKLFHVYWIFGVAGSHLLEFILLQLMAGFGEQVNPQITASIFFLIFIGYSIFIGVSIWRSANNYKGKNFWAWLAKASIVFAGIRLIGSFYRSFL